MRRKITLWKVLLIYLLTFLVTSQAGSVSAGINIWTSIGPDGGYINTLAMDPTTPGTLYAGTGGGGVFRSTNGAGSWSGYNTSLTAPTVFSLVVDPVSTGMLYAGTLYGGVFAIQQVSLDHFVYLPLTVK